MDILRTCGNKPAVHTQSFVTKANLAKQMSSKVLTGQDTYWASVALEGLRFHLLSFYVHTLMILSLKAWYLVVFILSFLYQYISIFYFALYSYFVLLNLLHLHLKAWDFIFTLLRCAEAFSIFSRALDLDDLDLDDLDLDDLDLDALDLDDLDLDSLDHIRNSHCISDSSEWKVKEALYYNIHHWSGKCFLFQESKILFKIETLIWLHSRKFSNHCPCFCVFSVHYFSVFFSVSLSFICFCFAFPRLTNSSCAFTCELQQWLSSNLLQKHSDLHWHIFEIHDLSFFFSKLLLPGIFPPIF